MRTIYYNGKVYTGNDELQQAFVVENDVFTYAGTNTQALKMADSGDKLVDLREDFVCPGFNDSHMHLMSFGNTLKTADLASHTYSLDEMVEYFAEFARKNCSESAWIVGRGWNQDYFSDADRMPDRFDLDKVSVEKPVIAVRCCGHALAINSKAIELLGVTADTPQPTGGSIGIKNGEPDGRFFDNAMNMVYAAIPAPGLKEVKDMIRAGCAALNAYGVTSCQSDDFSSFANLDWRTVKQAYSELENDGELSVRVYEQCNFADPESLKEFIKEGNVTGAGSYFYKTGPLKLLGDGALGARTALLSRPYADAPDTCGLPVFSEDTISEMVGIAHDAGMQCAIHAIGDKCLDWVLNAYEKALSRFPRKDHRHGVVHCQITRPDQLNRMADMELHIYAQTIFIDYDSRIVRERVGDKLAESSYNWKTLMHRSLSVSNGTDSPVERPDALRGIQCAVTRRSIGSNDTPYLPSQAFSVKEALDSYTINGAEGSFEEGVKGTIKAGMLADFVVLEENPFECDVESIHSINVKATYLGGNCVYGEI
ncbi:MAG: amidohydrolase [Clostridia bacterium]|nr:amidohydrolase [Clostridia bacterium]